MLGLQSRISSVRLINRYEPVSRVISRSFNLSQSKYRSVDRLIDHSNTRSMSTINDSALDERWRIVGDNDWVADLDLSTAKSLINQSVNQSIEQSTNQHQPRILILYGSLRATSYSRLLAFEFARILNLLGAEVRVFDPTGLPMKDEANVTHPKVVELRGLSQWSSAQVWVSPEQHGAISGVFKNQIDWIPLEIGSVRPTQGRVLAVAQANGGSQSFNVVNTLRLLGRWMRMFTIPNQSSVPQAWTQFDADGRMKPSSYRDRVVDVAEELYRFAILLEPHSDMLVDRYSEREEKKAKGRLLTQAEKLASAPAS